MAHDEIFDLDKTRDRSRLRDTETPAPAGGLDALVGRRRQKRVTDGAGQDLPRLVAMVDAAAADRAPMPMVSTPTSIRRSRRRIDRVSAVAAAVAVVTVALASTFTAVQIANASPVGDAAVQLQSEQDTLLAAESGLTASRVQVAEQIESGVAAAESFQTALRSLVPSEVEQPFVSAEAFAAADTAAAQYTAALRAIALPEELPRWSPPQTDEESLASVAAAIAEVQARAELVDGIDGELRAARQSTEAAATGFTSGADAFSAALLASTPGVLDDAPAAQQSLRDALMLASTAAGAADLTTAEGAAALLAYRDAVRAVRDDQARAEDREAGRDRGMWTPPQAPAPDDSGTTDPGTSDPTDPGVTPDPGDEPAPDPDAG